MCSATRQNKNNICFSSCLEKGWESLQLLMGSVDMCDIKSSFYKVFERSSPPSTVSVHRGTWRTWGRIRGQDRVLFHTGIKTLHAGVGVGVSKGSLVSWFQSFLASWFRSLVSNSWFLGLKVSNFQKSLSIVERYWSHITKIWFRAFWKILSHIQYFQECIRRIVGICRCSSFPKISKLRMCLNF